MLETESEDIDFGETVNVVIIQVLNERHLIEVEYVKEIYVPGENIISVPLAEKSIAGIINVRGEIYSITISTMSPSADSISTILPK